MSIISCNITGGLGNQLFQLFATIAVGLQYRYKIVFPYEDQTSVGKQRTTYWNTFLKSMSMMTTKNKRHGFVNQDVLGYPPYVEQQFHYSPLGPFTESTTLYGYFQSDRYFAHCKDTIFRLIRLREQQEALVQTYAHYFSSGLHTIAMHFRLGDYKQLQHNHPLLPYEYYRDALSHIREQKKEGIHVVLYFCEEEDKDIVMEMIDQLHKEYPQVVFERISSEISDWEQMLMMSCCSDLIIANSTFSWWGAYFNEKTDAIVCYPSLWFGPNLSHDTKDLFPGSWTKVTVVKN